jgi:replication-associated recombination protein RarA
MIHKIITKNGYDFFECSSAFQKSIRRGMEDEALFWMAEFSLSNFSEYVWKRIRIISSEDVGLAEPNISSEIMALYDLYKEQLKKKDEKHYPERLFMVHAVILLCRAKKSRLVDWQTCYVFGCHQNRLRVVPEFAFDKHTEKGKKMGRGFAHFLEEGCKLENEVILPGEIEAMENAKKYLGGHCGHGLFD